MTQDTRIDLDSITLADNYMVVTVFSDPEHCRQLLERLLGMRIRKVVLATGEKALAPSPESHGIRMDVYAEDDANTVYDVEMQASLKGNLGLRARYYQSTIDGDLLAKGVPYSELRRSFVIFVCTFDPFGLELARYTFTSRCSEKEFELNDRCARVFINADAWQQCEDPRLRTFLRYLKRGIIEGDDQFLRDIDAAVRRTREGQEWRTSRMKWEQHIMEERAEARAEDRAEMRLLAEALVADGRPELIVQALADEELYDRLLERYGIAEKLAFDQA